MLSRDVGPRAKLGRVARARKIGQHTAMDALAAFRLLSLQLEWGADEALLDAPIDRFARPVAVSERQGGRVATAPAVARSPASGPAALADCATIAGLRAAIAAFDGCALRVTATSTVLPEGQDGAATLLIGDPPNEDDDRAGRPFAGAAGAYLDRMLASIRVSRAELLVAPLIPWRPPGGRPPSPSEIAQCLPFLHRLILLARPRRLVLAGSLAAGTLLGPGARARGWVDARLPDQDTAGPDAAIPALPLPALAAIMRTPARRRDAWDALRRLRRALDAG